MVVIALRPKPKLPPDLQAREDARQLAAAQVEEQYQNFDVVWAKMSGYPWWPAVLFLSWDAIARAGIELKRKLVIPPPTQYVDTNGVKRREVYALIMFLDKFDCSVCKISPATVCSFALNYERLSRQPKPKPGFKPALERAERMLHMSTHISEDELDAVTALLPVTPPPSPTPTPTEKRRKTLSFAAPQDGDECDDEDSNSGDEDSEDAASEFSVDDEDNDDDEEEAQDESERIKRSTGKRTSNRQSKLAKAERTRTKLDTKLAPLLKATKNALPKSKRSLNRYEAKDDGAGCGELLDDSLDDFVVRPKPRKQSQPAKAPAKETSMKKKSSRKEGRQLVQVIELTEEDGESDVSDNFSLANVHSGTKVTVTAARNHMHGKSKANKRSGLSLQNVPSNARKGKLKGKKPYPLPDEKKPRPSKRTNKALEVYGDDDELYVGQLATSSKLSKSRKKSSTELRHNRHHVQASVHEVECDPGDSAKMPNLDTPGSSIAYEPLALTPLSHIWTTRAKTVASEKPMDLEYKQDLVWDDALFSDNCSQALTILEIETDVGKSNVSGRDRPQRQSRSVQQSQIRQSMMTGNLDPHTMVQCESYLPKGVKVEEGNGRIRGPPMLEAPFQVSVHPDVVFVCDLHSHLATCEIIGFLAGRWEHASKTLYIQAAFPCRSLVIDGDDGSTDVEMDPESEIELRAIIQNAELEVVGWYHSHPAFAPDPSIRDIENQASYQQLFMRRTKVEGVENEWEVAEPFVGLIVGTYDTRRDSPVGLFRYFHVREERVSSAVKRAVYMPYELIPTRRQYLAVRADVARLKMQQLSMYPSVFSVLFGPTTSYSQRRPKLPTDQVHSPPPTLHVPVLTPTKKVTVPSRKRKADHDHQRTRNGATSIQRSGKRARPRTKGSSASRNRQRAMPNESQPRAAVFGELTCIAGSADVQSAPQAIEISTDSGEAPSESREVDPACTCPVGEDEVVDLRSDSFDCADSALDDRSELCAAQLAEREQEQDRADTDNVYALAIARDEDIVVMSGSDSSQGQPTLMLNKVDAIPLRENSVQGSSSCIIAISQTTHPQENDEIVRDSSQDDEPSTKAATGNIVDGGGLKQPIMKRLATDGHTNKPFGPQTDENVGDLVHGQKGADDVVGASSQSSQSEWSGYGASQSQSMSQSNSQSASQPECSTNLDSGVCSPTETDEDPYAGVDIIDDEFEAVLDSPESKLENGSVHVEDIASAVDENNEVTVRGVPVEGEMESTADLHAKTTRDDELERVQMAQEDQIIWIVDDEIIGESLPEGNENVESIEENSWSEMKAVQSASDASSLPKLHTGSPRKEQSPCPNAEVDQNSPILSASATVPVERSALRDDDSLSNGNSGTSTPSGGVLSAGSRRRNRKPSLTTRFDNANVNVAIAKSPRPDDMVMVGAGSRGFFGRFSAQDVMSVLPATQVKSRETKTCEVAAWDDVQVIRDEMLGVPGAQAGVEMLNTAQESSDTCGETSRRCAVDCVKDEEADMIPMVVVDEDEFTADGIASSSVKFKVAGLASDDHLDPVSSEEQSDAADTYDSSRQSHNVALTDEPRQSTHVIPEMMKMDHETFVVATADLDLSKLTNQRVADSNVSRESSSKVTSILVEAQQVMETMLCAVELQVEEDRTTNSVRGARAETKYFYPIAEVKMEAQGGKSKSGSRVLFGANGVVEHYKTSIDQSRPIIAKMKADNGVSSSQTTRGRLDTVTKVESRADPVHVKTDEAQLSTPSLVELRQSCLATLRSKYGRGVYGCTEQVITLIDYYRDFERRTNLHELWKPRITKAEKIEGSLRTYVQSVNIRVNLRDDFIDNVMGYLKSSWELSNRAKRL